MVSSDDMESSNNEIRSPTNQYVSDKKKLKIKKRRSDAAATAIDIMPAVISPLGLYWTTGVIVVASMYL